MEPRPEYPRPDRQRSRWMNLNGEWEFGAGERPLFDRRIVVPFCPESELSGVANLPGDVVWYRRRFDAPEADVVHLHFGAVDYHATVWLNDIEVARHEGGHVPFTADITHALRRRDNVLMVRVDDALTDRTIPRGKQYWKPESESIFYTPTTGVWQTVWLEPLPVNHISRLRLMPDLETGALDFELDGTGEAAVTATLDGQVVGRWSGSPGRGRIQLEHVAPWQPEAPQLYGLEATLLDRDHKTVDRVESQFGLRNVECRDGRFWLNGEPFVQRLVLDQGYFPGGLMTAPTDEVLRGDIELAKVMGFNGARKHQKIEDPRWLYWADVLGFLVWSEMPSFHQHSPEAERRLAAEWTAAVQRDRDHPSVVAWVPANESFGLADIDPALRANFLTGLYRLTHDLDGTRPVVTNDGWEHAVTDVCTIHDYSASGVLPSRYRSVERAFEGGEGHAIYLPGFSYRGEPILVTEFGGLHLTTSSGFGYLDVDGEEEFLDTYEALIRALMDPGPVEGFCYTQLTDVEQEQNGLLSFDRAPKLDPSLVRPLTEQPKRRLSESRP